MNIKTLGIAPMILFPLTTAWAGGGAYYYPPYPGYPLPPGQGTFPPPVVNQGVFIQPAQPTASDNVVVWYPRRACSGDSANAQFNKNSIEIVVKHSDVCISPAFNQFSLGQLPVGNYFLSFRFDGPVMGGNAPITYTLNFAVNPSR